MLPDAGAFRARCGAVHVLRLPAARLDAAVEALLGVPGGRRALPRSGHGKPYWPDGGLELSFSHSGAWALWALAEVSVGVDLEAPRRLHRRDALLARCYTAAERVHLERVGADEIVRYWCAKEAVVKALGRGIAHGLRRVELAPAGDRLRLERLDGADGGRSWQLVELPPWSGHVAFLAHAGIPRPVRCWTWPEFGAPPPES